MADAGTVSDNACGVMLHIEVLNCVDPPSTQFRRSILKLNDRDYCVQRVMCMK